MLRPLVGPAGHAGSAQFTAQAQVTGPKARAGVRGAMMRWAEYGLLWVTLLFNILMNFSSRPLMFMARIHHVYRL